MLKTVYFISGLGADNRAFQSMDLSFCNPVFLQWIEPLPGEDMSSYARRFLPFIADPEPVIVGLSFGGIMAVEIAKHIAFKKVILISSASNHREVPPYFRFLKWLPLHRWVGVENIKKLNGFAYQLMGISQREDKVVFMQMFNEANNAFVGWAIDQIVHWKSPESPKNLVHIHGTHDILLPYVFVKADITLRRGKHLAPMIKPREIADILRQVINE